MALSYVAIKQKTASNHVFDVFCIIASCIVHYVFGCAFSDNFCINRLHRYHFTNQLNACLRSGRFWYVKVTNIQ